MLGPRFESLYESKEVGGFRSTKMGGYVQIRELQRNSFKKGKSPFRYAEFHASTEEKVGPCIEVRCKATTKYLGTTKVWIRIGFGYDWAECKDVKLVHIPIFNSRLQRWSEKRVWVGKHLVRYETLRVEVPRW